MLSTKEEFSLCLKTITCLMLLLTAVPADCKVKATSGNKPQLEQLSDTRFALEDLEIDIQDARLRAAHGFGMGDVVECRERCAYGPPKVWRMQVTKVLFYQRENGRGHPALVSLEGLKLKKDGTVGKMKGSVYYHDVDKVKLIEGGE